jgi:hypothetical protein
MTDVEFVDHGSVWVMTPRTDAGRAWIEDNVFTGDSLTWGAEGVVVEPRMLLQLCERLSAAGLSYERVP